MNSCEGYIYSTGGQAIESVMQLTEFDVILGVSSMR